MANFPSSVSTNSNLYVAVNGVQTTLAASILATDTTIQLTSTTGFPATGYVTIDNSEVVLYTGISGPNLTGCSRGADGTTAAPHSLGVTVGATIVAAHHNLLKDEIIAIETFLGVGGANVQPAGNYIIALTGDVSATGPGSVPGTVNTVGGSSAANVHSAELSANAATSAPTASTIVKRDANSNTKVNTVIENFSTTVTAAGTTALTASTSPIQQFTGTSTQTVTLPDATTLAVGYQITVLNRSTGAVTVNNNSGLLQSSVAATNQAIFTCTSTGSANGTWDVSTSSAASGGTVTSVSGTANQITSTNPTTTPVIALANPLTTPGSVTVSGNITFNPTTNGIVGTTTNDNAASGKVGEYVSAAASSTNFPATITFGDLVSISLTAGDWDVAVMGQINNNSATPSGQYIVGASTSAGNSGTGLIDGTTDFAVQGFFSGTNMVAVSIPRIRFSLSSTTTVYLKYYATYSAGTPQLAGSLTARRVR